MRRFLYIMCIITVSFVLYTREFVYSNTVVTPVKKDAQEYLQESIDDILSILQNPEWKTKEGQKKLYPFLQEKVRSLFAFEAIASQVVGVKWKTFTEKEQEAFIEAFGRMLEYTYASSFINYKGQNVEIINTRKNNSGTQVEITTHIVDPSGKKTVMVYRLLSVNEEWKVYNVIVENINLIVSYKTQLQELLALDKPSVIIEKLQNKVEILSVARQ